MHFNQETENHFFIMLIKQLQMQVKLLQKEQFKTPQKQPVISLLTKLQINLENSKTIGPKYFRSIFKPNRNT